MEDYVLKCSLKLANSK